ncbi:hypothetical protein C9374_006500 [Naegleria lovaniensis]|uniref:F-box domain-containing protein n=1 Tax=Naegleria lovaniensis TaxID=51637 RepID=A0AA88GIC5_NAELO|nr:uncharacterized protein C9374_006500 [Naegleria lovaniensis]KAG2381511.1 hypothetical protein C9374_006500 [Naegleria lovaniensis]
MSLPDHEDFTSRTSMMTIFGNDLILEIIGNYLELVDILSLSSVCQVISFSISNLSIWKNYYFDHLRAFENFRSNFESNSPSKKYTFLEIFIIITTNNSSTRFNFYGNDSKLQT